jgi:hypothetical protein
VLEAFDTLFNKRDYDAAARFWSDKYVQHSAHIEPVETWRHWHQRDHGDDPPRHMMRKMKPSATA